MRNMKRGVVAQLIYMLVLIAIAVVVGLFFMTVVEKNKKNTTEQAYAEISFDATKSGTGSYVILANRNPTDVISTLNVYCHNGTSYQTVKSNIQGDFYPYGAGYRYEFSYTGTCKEIKINGTDTAGKARTYLVKVLE